MSTVLELLLLILGGALVAEGLFYALFPNKARRMIEMVGEASPQTLQVSGLVALALGVLVFWLARSMGT